jgi:uncharacterized membrane protein YdjX (TVP38/TMEM64 family)
MSINHKNIIGLLWIAVIFAVSGFTFLNKDQFDSDAVVRILSTTGPYVLLTYSLVSVVRGMFLIPSTPFVIAGTVMFPETPILILSITLVSIILTTIVLYYFPKYLKYDQYFNQKYSTKLDKYIQPLKSKYSLLFCAGWALIPFTPTDLVSYLAGVVKLPFWRVLVGILIGEIILCSIYIYLTLGII